MNSFDQPRQWNAVPPRPVLVRDPSTPASMGGTRRVETAKEVRKHMWHAGYESGKQSVNVSAWFLAGYLGGVAMACFVIYFGSQLLVGIV